MALGALLKVKMDSTAVARGLRTIRAGFGRLSSAVGRLRGAWGKLKGSAIGAMFGAIAAQVANTVRWMAILRDEIENTGAKGKDILAIRSALEISGLDANQASTVLNEFQKRLGEATLGTGEAVLGLKELDLKIRDIAHLPAATAFKMVMNAVKNSGKDAKVLLMALDKLFGGEGQKMFGLARNWDERIELGAEATKDLADAFDRLGKGNGIRELQARFAQFRNSMRLFWMEFVQKLPLGAVADMLTAIAEKAPQIIDSITAFFKDPMGEGSWLRAITDWIDGLFTRLMNFVYEWGEHIKEGLSPLVEALTGKPIPGKYDDLLPAPGKGPKEGVLDQKILDAQKKSNDLLLRIARDKAVWG